MSAPRSRLVLEAVCFLVLSSSLRAYTPTTATQSLLGVNPDVRPVAQGQRLVALYGVPFASDADPATTTDQFVENWLFDPVDGHKAALGGLAITGWWLR